MPSQAYLDALEEKGLSYNWKSRAVDVILTIGAGLVIYVILSFIFPDFFPMI